MVDVNRRARLGNAADRSRATKVETFIDSEKEGAGRWPDQSEVLVPGTDCVLKIRDKVGRDWSPRHVVVYKRGRHGLSRKLLFTLVYDPRDGQLVETF